MIGHDQVRTSLERELYPAVLLHGPESIGKRTLVAHLATHHQIPEYDFYANANALTVDMVRHVRTWSAKAPFARTKLIALHLDAASVAAQNALLKTLEEPPGTARFLLTASGPVLPTIMSRCLVHRLGRLTDDQVEQVLLSLGHPSAKAKLAAPLGHGQVKRALHALTTSADQRNAVIAVMQAISRGDRDGFARGFAAWGDYSADLLSTWFTETLTGQHQIFTADETFGLGSDRTLLMNMISALVRSGRARPRLAARAALEPFLTR